MIRYAESAPPPDLSAVVEAEWRVEGIPGERVRILADACTDLIALGPGAREILFNGPMAVADITELQVPVTFGLRFRPGILAEVVPSLRLSEMRDKEVIVANPIAASSEIDGLRAFARHLIATDRLKTNPVVDAILEMLADRPDSRTLMVAMAAAPASERTIQRFFLEFVGLTPQQTVGVIRQNNVGRALRTRIGGLAELANAHGYADQSHLTRDFTRLAGLPPGRYAREVAFDGFVQDDVRDA
ncbi:helix-turn-helix domain-containing protein [Leifsonia shinshuensis]|uniref:helix-turn-helix transcriptional regulator n=1 Tax=Leifsonia shinshuensis TaxID=150026 RepID=UPI001F505097|nr:helix-turn-helix domain-containing protein [Leifsonia shinshuensis]MCI0159422.1 helix-turn-helix domain-containing protein [Leifsonia shinshuensis]